MVGEEATADEGPGCKPGAFLRQSAGRGMKASPDHWRCPMADLDHLDPPAPRSTEHWKLPTAIRIEGDGVDPTKTKLFDDVTGEELKLSVNALRFEVDVNIPNRVEIVLGGVSIRATVHFVQYTIDTDDLAMLAKQNGYRIEKVPAYPARMSSYGPTEIEITFRDFPKMPPVIHRNIRRHEAIEQAEKDLFGYIERMKGGRGIVPPPSEPEEGEFLIWAHPVEE